MRCQGARLRDRESTIASIVRLIYHQARPYYGPIKWEDYMSSSRFSVAAGAGLLVAWLGSPSLADIISDWSKVVAPPAPELKEVTVDPSTTALLFLDIMKGNCSARPRCV